MSTDYWNDFDYWDREFGKFIKGKRVVFVGGGSCNTGKSLGRFIDSFDVVIRTNNAINLLGHAEYKRDFGAKVDILYVNNQFHRHARPLPIPDYVTKGVKWVCTKMKHFKYLDWYRRQGVNSRSIHKTMTGVTEKCPSATMGNFIWMDVLQNGPRELYLTGVDFFASRKKVFETGNYHEYFPGYLPGGIVAEGDRINQGKTEDGHNFYANAVFTYGLTRTYKNLTMADETRELLQGIVDHKIDQV